MTCTYRKRASYTALCIALSFSTFIYTDIDITNQALIKKEKSENTRSGNTTNKLHTFVEKEVDYHYKQQLQEAKKIIRHIYVKENRLVSKESILVRLPFSEGKPFNILQSSQAIKNVYGLGYFRQVQLYADDINDNEIDLYVVVTEKPKLSHITFKGNKHIATKELKKETGLDKTVTLNEEELKNFIARIKKIYRKKNYHFTQVSATLEQVDKHHVAAHFTIKEKKKSYIQQIHFKGNHQVPSKKLKRILFSKEYWILSPIDRSGAYQPEMIEADKALIEDGYKSNGFLHAKVAHVDVQHNEKEQAYIITYTINEGDVYHIKSIDVEGNDTLSSQQLKNAIPIREGQRYSIELLRNSIEKMRLLWGEYGYIFADIEPTLDIDDDEKAVSIKFYFDLKDKVYLNRLTIKGNKKARDKVIRRQLTLDEGELITNKKMDETKNRIKLMGYFDERDGVNWKTTRIDDNLADLDLMLKEVKTGKFNLQITYGGGSKASSSNGPNKGISTNIILADRNLFGSGIAASAITEISKRYKSITTSLLNPWIFDKPIRGMINAYHKRSEYDDGIKYAEQSPYEINSGGFVSGGYVTPWFGECLINGELGFETINFKVDKEESDKLSNQTSPVRAAKRLSEQEQLYYQEILNRNFQSGDQYWAKVSVSQDRRNGLAFTTNGYQWNAYSQIAFPMTSNGFKYLKAEIDGSWYTPLIGDSTLVLCLHGHAGFTKPLSGKNAPWRSMFHIGGPSTVRGYTYGQIGPTWLGDSIGATKAFFINAELIMPLTQDQGTRAVIFYDGGAGWDAAYKDDLRKVVPNFDTTVENDDFFYRHSVGIGIRLTTPSPIQIDFGIKLNPSKKFKNKLTEVHFNMSHEF